MVKVFLLLMFPCLWKELELGGIEHKNWAFSCAVAFVTAT